MKNAQGNGYSLVEISIVLVIIGILVGSVLTGKSLITAAETRAVITEYGQYNEAVNLFKETYFGLPGNIREPNQLIANCNKCIAGDGKGFILDKVETYEAWVELNAAGMISFLPTSNPTPRIGVNMPASKAAGAGWQLAASDKWYKHPKKNGLILGGNNDPLLANFNLSSDRALSIDSKIDDGFPRTGNVLTFGNAVGNENKYLLNQTPLNHIIFFFD